MSQPTHDPRSVPPLAPQVPPPVPPPVAGRAGTPVVSAADDDRGRGGPRWGAAPAWATSLVVHMWLLLVAALVVWEAPRRLEYPGLLVSTSQPSAAVELPPLNLRPPEIELPGPMALDRAVPLFADTPGPPSIQLGPLAPPWKPVATGAAARPVDWLATAAPRGGGLGGRSPEARARLVATRGGSRGSERAVERGLRWLMAHQLEDGSWRLDFHKSPQCAGLCRNPGQLGSTTASTALALLPFLGAGHTHHEGEYREVVERGLYYLTGRMLVDRRGGDLQEGTMYGQGLATIALSEAYAMTGDEALGAAAQHALDFIVSAQHPKGGWRYLPGQPGDTTSLGWQWMALKSGQLARLRVPSPTLHAAGQFLDSVETESGAGYGYQRPEKQPTTTAIGLLCRMYQGRGRDHEALRRGIDYLAERGPSENNLYFNYYATQVLNHDEGPHWKAWNLQLREHLIATQAVDGHEAGSWHFDEPHTREAGRLYNTAMAVMILEVYYRYLPLYGEGVMKDEG